MGIWTNAGSNLVASAVQSASGNCALTYVGISTGCGTLANPLNSGVTYASIGLSAGLPVALVTGQALTITDGVNRQSVTTSAPVSIGATAIPVTSFVANFTFAAGTAGVCPTPLASDVALYNETVRFAAFAGAPGAAAGESLTQGYADGTQATGVYLLVGYFGGALATSSVGTGTLMGEDVSYWNHVLNVDSNMYQADSTV